MPRSRTGSLGRVIAASNSRIPLLDTAASGAPLEDSGEIVIRVTAHGLCERSKRTGPFVERLAIQGARKDFLVQAFRVRLRHERSQHAFRVPYCLGIRDIGFTPSVLGQGDAKHIAGMY